MLPRISEREEGRRQRHNILNVFFLTTEQKGDWLNGTAFYPKIFVLLIFIILDHNIWPAGQMCPANAFILAREAQTFVDLAYFFHEEILCMC
jgi:hypothetical protein